MTCLRCKHREAKRFRFYGRDRIQQYRGPGCKATFSEPRRKPLGRHYIETAKAAQALFAGSISKDRIPSHMLDSGRGSIQSPNRSEVRTVRNRCRTGPSPNAA
jgi:hypothetical protein